MNWWVCLLPFAGALTGLLINVAVIKLWLRPAYVRKNSKLIARRLVGMAREFVSLQEVEDKIVNTESLNKLMPMIEGHVDEFLKVKLSKEIPYLGMFIGEKTISSLKKIFMQEMETLFPQVMKDYMSNLKHQFDPEKIIADKLFELEPGSMEKTLNPVIGKRFLLLGTVAGFIIGLVQVLLILIVIN